MTDDPNKYLLGDDNSMELLAMALLEDIYQNVVVEAARLARRPVILPQTVDEKILLIHGVMEADFLGLPYTAEHKQILRDDLKGFCESFNKLPLLETVEKGDPINRHAPAPRRQ